MTILLATAFMSLGLINLNFGPMWWRGQSWRLLVGVPALLVYSYFEMPPLVFPQALVFLLVPLVPNAAFSLLLSARAAVASRRIVSIRRGPPALPYVVAVGAIGVFALVLAVAPILDANGLRDVAAVTVSSALPPQADLAHVRVVPQESAEFAGNKVVGQLGTYYHVGTFNVQSERGRLVWVAPLEFGSTVQWLSRGTSPGVIVVDAENPDAPAELRKRRPMRYVPSARLNDNLYRHVYMTYGREQILETTLQLDEDGDPRYLATLGRPTVGWSGQVVTGVVVVDPETGAMTRYARGDFAQLPHWVSRVYPPDLALAYNQWFGAYVHGLWNYLIVKRDVHVPARDEVFGLLAGGRFVWFVDHTSPAADQSMTGFTYMDSVDGSLTYYTASGGEFNSRGAEDAVASNPVVRQGRLQPTQPILYNAFGRNTWVVPLIANTGKYQSLALVEAANGRVVVGSSASVSPQSDAFAQYAAVLGVGGGARTGVQTTRRGVLDRVAVSNGTLYFTVRGDKQLFSADAASDPRPLLARPGDGVTFGVTPGDVAPIRAVRAFRDEALSL